jgi:hypothetical protein
MQPDAIDANDVSAGGQYPLIAKNTVVIGIPVHPDKKRLRPVKLPKKQIRCPEELFKLRIRNCRGIIHWFCFVRNPYFPTNTE